MRLLSAVVENYRVHRSASLSFAPGLTLLVAPNESGKSTLVEALHRVLFQPHRKGGEALKGMISRDGGHPTVELCFEVGGRIWVVRKVFRGQQGSCSLRCESPAAEWQGDDAEERLAALLAGDAPAEARPTDRWDHLWVTQGRSHEDPLRTTGASELFAALAAGEGAGALSLGPDDLALIETVREETDATWGVRGGLREGCELGRLETGLAAAEADARTAVARRDDHQDLIEQLRQHQSTAQRTEPEVATRREALADLAGSIEEARQRQHALELEQVKATSAEDELGRHDEAVAHLDELRNTVETLNAQNSNLREQLDQRNDALAREQSEEARFVQQANQARQRLQDLANQRELAEALDRTRDLEKEVGRLEGERERREKLTVELRKQQAKLDGLPTVEAKDLKQLEKLGKDLHAKRAALSAMAATICWEAGKGPARLGGKPLTLGRVLSIEDAAALEVAGNRIRLRPGGGASLAETRAEVLELEDELKQKLKAFGVGSVEEAAQAWEDRRSAQDRVGKLQERLDDQEDPAPDLVESTAELANVRRQRDMLRKAGATVPKGQGADSLRAQERAERKAFNGLAKSLESARERVETEGERRAKAAEESTEVATALRLAREERASAEKLLGTESDRRRHRNELAGRLAEAQQRVATLLESLGDIDLSLLEKRRNLQEQSLKQLEAEFHGARSSAQTLSNQLGATVDRDLEAEVDEAESRVRRIRLEVTEARTRAEGTRLLYETLCVLRDEARERRETPFLEAVTRYLDVVFRGARVGLDLDGEQRVLGLVDRSRSGLGAFAFPTLSRGTQELVGAVARLAMAEVIAERRPDRCLPVVFDDAFASLDPERLDQLGLMLDVARKRGLQVIVLSCNDRDCGNIGEDTLIRLQRPRFAPGLATTLVPGADEAPGEVVRVPLALGDPTAGPTANGPPVLRVGEHAELGRDEADLLASVPGDGSAISTRALRAALGWDIQRFHSVVDALSSRGIVVRPTGERSIRRARAV